MIQVSLECAAWRVLGFVREERRRGIGLIEIKHSYHPQPTRHLVQCHNKSFRLQGINPRVLRLRRLSGLPYKLHANKLWSETKWKTSWGCGVTPLGQR